MRKAGSLALTAPLFVPGNRPERFAKAGASMADAVIVDLEDAVAADSKETARAALYFGFTGKPSILRVNGFDTPWHDADIAAALKSRPTALMVPKAQDADRIERLYETTGLPLIALIESAVGIANARLIGAARGVAGLAFGSIDYCADLGCDHTRDALLSARAEIVLAARLAGLEAPLDGVSTVIHDAAAIAGDARHAAALGFGGKLCIHPAQVAPVFEGFKPDADKIAWAERVLASGSGVQSVDGEMIDEPVRLRAHRILSLR